MRRFFDHLSAAQMHSCDLLQLAAILALHGPELAVRQPEHLDANLGSYWLASRRRIDSWNRHLRQLSAATAHAVKIPSPANMLEEIIVSEPLTRVWTAIVVASHQNSQRNKAQAVVENIMNAHLTIRHHAMSLLARHSINPETTPLLAQLESRTARWTDLLIAYLEQNHRVSHLAPHPERSLDFAEDLHSQARRPGSHTASAITLAAMRQAICCKISPKSHHANLNFQIGAAIVDSCDAEVLESAGLFDALCAIRIIHTTVSCQKMLSDSLNETSLPVTGESIP
jgi:hypothetical protein